MGTHIEILNHDPKSEVEIIVRALVKYIIQENRNSLLSYTSAKFTPSGFLRYSKEKVDSEALLMMPTTPMEELYNLRGYIQHLILESECDCGDDEFINPLNEDSWLYRTRGNSSNSKFGMIFRRNF